MKQVIQKIYVVALIFFCFACKSAQSRVINPDSLTLNFGKVEQEHRDDLYQVGIQPEFTIGAAYAVFDVNLFFDHEFRLRDNGNDMIVLDAVGYKKEGFRLHYGDIEALTLGRGFIVRNYYSNTMSNVPVNEQKGLIAQRWNDRSGLGLFGTLSHLYGGRAERRMGKASVGTTVVGDSEPDFREWGIDAGYKPHSSVEIYAESAQIEHYGTGFALGSVIKPLENAQLLVEYRKFDADFVPGIVDEHYEARPAFNTIAANPAGRVDGYFTELSLFNKTNFPVKITYEDYEATDPRLTFSTDMNFSERLKLNLFFAQENFIPSQSTIGENSVVKGKLTIGITNYIFLITEYYRAFDDAKQPLESITFRARIHL